MGKIPSKPVVTNQPWINGVTKLNQVNLTNGVNQNITNIKTAVDGIIDALGGPGADPGNFEEITWADLKALRDGGNLVPDKLYRITDYVTTTSEENTHSAGHQFDVIVKALSADKLSEEAHAILHEGDTYFANSNLNAWKLWYSIDNDTNRFDWADATNGKGVIYRMIDEFRNDLPYDFKNIQFKRYKGDVVAEGSSQYPIRYPKFINMHDYYVDVCENEQIANKAQKAYEIMRKITKYLGNDAIPCLYSLGTMEYAKVEDLSEDLANFLTDSSHGALSNDDYVVAICGEEEYDGYLCALVIDSSTPFYFYTFSNGSSSSSTGAITSITDQSLGGGVYQNVFETHNSRYSLQSNVFIGGNFHSNFIRAGFESNTVGSFFFSNTVGNSFYHNTVGYNFNSNNLGNDFNSNIVGNGFNSNVVGNSFYFNTIGNYCHDNTVNEDFYFNIVGDSFISNTVRNGFSNNIVGEEFYHNSVKDDFSYNTVGHYFRSNTVGNGFSNNTVENAFSSNSVGEYFEGNTVGVEFVLNTVGSDFKYNAIGSLSDGAFIQYCIFDNGVQYVSLTSPDAYDNDNYIQNVHLHLGVKGASSSNRLEISVPRALPYEAEYYLDDLGNLTVSNFSTRIAWKDLKDLRDAGKLVPGKQYRIIDYLTAVEQPECCSAEHPFDIVVTALTSNTLSEDAKAVVRKGDNYFVESIGAAWKPGITISDIKLLYYMTDSEDRYSPPRPQTKERTFTQMGMMVNPATGIEVPYLFEPDPDHGGAPSGNDRRYLFVGEYEFNGVIYDQWEECYADGTSAKPDEGWAYYELTNVVVDCERNFIEKAKLSAWKLKYCLDNDYDRFGFAVRHDVIRVQFTNPPTYLYLRYPSLDGDDGLAWVFVNNTNNLEIEDPSVDYDNLDTSDVVYTPTLSINVGDVFLVGGDPVTVLATRIGKGVIYEMEDEWGNKLPYDFKNVQFKRYRVVHSSFDHTSFDGQYVGCKDIDGNMGSPRVYIIQDDSDFRWYYTFTWYNENSVSEDYSIVGNNRIHSDDGYICGCYKNVFGICVEYDMYPSVETPMNRMYLGNNVIYEDYADESGITYGIDSNTVGNAFFNNTMRGNFSCNVVGNGFTQNTTGKHFRDNNVGNIFSSNVVGDEFSTNTIGDIFSSNVVGDGFGGNTVSHSFEDNFVKDSFSGNIIGHSFLHNTVGEVFHDSTVGNHFFSNTLGNYIIFSSVKDDVQYITLDAPSGTNNNYLKYITIGPSIRGASSANRLVITPVRNASHEQEYVNADKEVNQVTVS